MQNILIDEEFRTLLPALDTQTYALLEENILENGCREPITLWNDILIDGYNRHRICTEHIKRKYLDNANYLRYNVEVSLLS